MSIVVLGAGGIGGYLGIRMIEAGLPVRFLLRDERAARVRRDGLSLKSPLGDWSGSAEVVTREGVGPADFVILSCKAYDLDGALEAIAGAAHGISPTVSERRPSARMRNASGTATRFATIPTGDTRWKYPHMSSTDPPHAVKPTAMEPAASFPNQTAKRCGNVQSRRGMKSSGSANFSIGFCRRCENAMMTTTRMKES